MATIDEVVLSGVLEVYEVPDWESRLPINRLWVSRDFWTEFDAMDGLHDNPFAGSRRTIGEHIEQAFCNFRCGERPGAGDLKCMVPSGKGVWKLHPPGARVYGWCPFQRAFVAVTVAVASDTKTDRTLNNRKQRVVSDFIRDNKLQQYIVRGDILAVFPPPT